MSSVRLIAISVAVSIACWTRGVHADEIGRTLGGHRYVPFSVVDWGFVESSFGTTLSAGQLRLDDDLITRSIIDRSSRLELLALEQSFDAGVAATPWLGLHLRGTGASVTAIAKDRETPLAVGAQAVLGAEAGAVVRLFRTGRFQLSARGDIGWARSFTPELLPGSAGVDRDIWRLRPALVAAMTLAPSVGVQASGSYELRDVEGEDDRAHRWGAGLGLSFAPYTVPVMFLVGGRYERVSKAIDRRLAVLNGGDGASWSGELGVFYHGRPDLDLGAAFVFAVADDDRRYLGHVRFKYYF